MPVRRRLALALVALVAALRFCETGAGNIDDAFILLVYVRHLVAGGGFYYNRADGAIDGFTSPLDLFVKSAIVRVTHADPIAVAWWTSLVLHVAIALCVFGVVERLARRRAANATPLALATVAGLVFASGQALADGSAFLLETPLCVLLALAATVWALFAAPRTWRAQLGFGLVLCALMLARPEGVPLALALLAVVWLQGARSIVAAALFAAGAAAYFAWRIRVFGYWAPNTYYAKTSASRWNELADGTRYVAAFLISPGAPSLVWLLVTPLVAWRARFADAPLRRAFVFATLLAWAMLAVTVWSGGDCYGGGRFLALPISLAMLALALALVDGMRLARIFAGVLVAVQLLVMLAVPIYVFGFSREPVRLPTSERAFACDRDSARAVAALVADRPSAGAIVAQTDFQRMKYFADDTYVLDLTGLNDRAIAHTRVDGPVQWGKIDLVDAANHRRPEIMILGHHTAPNARAMGRFPLAQVLADPSLHFDFWGYGLDGPSTQAVGAAYESASLPVCGGWFNFLVRKDLVEAMRARGAMVAGGS